MKSTVNFEVVLSLMFLWCGVVMSTLTLSMQLSHHMLTPTSSSPHAVTVVDSKSFFHAPHSPSPFPPYLHYEPPHHTTSHHITSHHITSHHIYPHTLQPPLTHFSPNPPPLLNRTPRRSRRN
ncbi:hypothetical protein EJ04DRAFT_6807 [Polyplosphaeria fusca]|uniref:Uncharacterized protein n=1 Tax=Polyplosphaeria fusca TaxID=682080 RepID=A0A9P4R8Z9_9PLEO|nr:hypothetical protein EJ04DRAFT_6807 [Polyplosphaeria fusca]